VVESENLVPRSKPAANAGVPFALGDTIIRAEGTNHRAIVVTPRAPMLYGHARLKRLRENPTAELSAPDRYLIDEVTRRRPRVAIFRAADDGQRRLWEFDPKLSDAEAEELGYRLTRALLPIHRRMLHRGVALMVHTEWGTRECYAMRYGVRKAAAELTATARGASSVTQVDTWILRNMLFHVALTIEHVTEKLLPDHVRMIERRWQRLKGVTEHLPPSVVD
jgi:hypothetical protein